MQSSMDHVDHAESYRAKIEKSGQSRGSVFQMPQPILDMPMGQGHPGVMISSEEENVRGAESDAGLEKRGMTE